MHGEPDQSLCGCALAVRNKFACWQIVWLSLPISRMASCMIYSHAYVIPPSTQPHNWSSLCVYVFPFNYETATACLPHYILLCRVPVVCRELHLRHTAKRSFAVCRSFSSQQIIGHTTNIQFPVVAVAARACTSTVAATWSHWTAGRRGVTGRRDGVLL